MRFLPSLVSITVVLLAACNQPRPLVPGKVHPANQVPPALQPAVARADAAIGDLRGRLLARLVDAMKAGPEAALEACHAEAPGIASAVEAQHGVAVGRTSHRLRNPANAPRTWARPHVEAAADQAAATAGALVVELGDRVGVLRPIPLGGMCATCHGTPAGALAEAIRRRYPTDRATGFAEGDLRGWFWAEVPR